MFTLLGYVVVAVGGLSVAAKLGKFTWELEKVVLGHSVEIELSKAQPLYFSIRKEQPVAGSQAG